MCGVASLGTTKSDGLTSREAAVTYWATVLGDMFIGNDVFGTIDIS